MSDRGRVGAVVALAAVYAACYSAIKLGLPYAPPLRYGGLRALMGGGALLALLLVIRRPILPPRHLWTGLGLVSATGTILAYGAMFASLEYTGAGIASVLGNTTPLLVMALAVPMLGERVTHATGWAMGLGLLGTALIAAPDIGRPVSGALGALLPLGAAAGFAVSSVLIKKLGVGDAFLAVAAWQLTLGGLVLLVASAVMEPGRALLWNPTFVGLLGFLALIGTALTTAVWYWLLQHDQVGRLSLALFATPALGLVLALTLFDERLAPIQIGGVGLVVATLALATSKRRT